MQGCAKTYLSQTWRLYKYEKNGVDQTSNFLAAYQNYQIVFDKNGNYTMSWTTIIPFTVTGTWRFTNGNTKLELTEDGSGDITVYDKNKLTASELDVTHYGSDTEKFYLEAK